MGLGRLRKRRRSLVELSLDPKPIGEKDMRTLLELFLEPSMWKER